MERFGQPHDPLMERVSDEELRELLGRLGEAELGGDDRATVGAVVEATGSDPATILRLLHEIRQRELDRQRADLAAVERRVGRLEARPRSLADEESFSSPGKRFALSVGCVVFGVLAIAGLKSWARDAGSTMPTYSTEIDGGTLTMGSDHVLRVVLPDGSTRAATPQEEGVHGPLLRAVEADSSRTRP